MLSTEQKAKPVDQLKRIGASLLKGLLSAFVALGYMAAVAKVIWGGIDQQPDLLAYASLLLVIVAFVLGIIIRRSALLLHR